MLGRLVWLAFCIMAAAVGYLVGKQRGRLDEREGLRRSLAPYKEEGDREGKSVAAAERIHSQRRGPQFVVLGVLVAAMMAASGAQAHGRRQDQQQAPACQQQAGSADVVSRSHTYNLEPVQQYHFTGYSRGTVHNVTAEPYAIPCNRNAAPVQQYTVPAGVACSPRYQVHQARQVQQYSPAVGASCGRQQHQVRDYNVQAQPYTYTYQASGSSCGRGHLQQPAYAPYSGDSSAAMSASHARRRCDVYASAY